MSVAVELPTFHRAPQELIDRPQWVTWKYEERNGKRTKVPYSPKNNVRADSTDAATWGTFAEALGAMEFWSLDGIGFVIAEDDPYFFIDLDGAIDIDVTESWAAAIVDAFPEAYWEVSPSGRGLHAIGRGAWPERGRRVGPVEVYPFDRFATITGRPLEDHETIQGDSTEALTQLHEIRFKRAPRAVSEEEAAKQTSPPMSDDEILALAYSARNGAKIQALLSGDISAYPSPSEADAAAAAHLAFYTQDAVQIERILRLSSLQRDKWDDNRTYMDRTIRNAIDVPGERYTRPGNIVDFRSKYNLGPPKEVTKSVHALNDTGNAQRLTDLFGEVVIHCRPRKLWYVWNQHYWEEDRTGEVVEMAKATARSIYREAAWASEHGKEDLEKSLAKHASTSANAGKINAMLDLARSIPGNPVLPEQFDTNPYLFNVENGTIDLTSGELRAPDKTDLITLCAPIAYDPYATCPNWEKFLEDVFNGDQDLIAYVQRLLGYCLTGAVTEDAFPVFYGGGSNGKSTLIEIVSEILGPYAWETSPDLLISSRNGNSDRDKQIIELRGKRFVTAIETGEGQALNQAVVKNLTGGDKLRGRALYQEAETFKPTHKLILATNKKPQVKGDDRATWRRIHLIPFEVTFWRDDDPERPADILSPKRADPELPDRLAAEKEGILAWMVRGCVAWKKDGLGIPQRIWDATAEYRKEEDTLGEFIADRCETGPRLSARNPDLYAAYSNWCEALNEYPVGHKAFSQQMRDRGYEQIRSNSARIWTGIGLKTPDSDSCDTSTRLSENFSKSIPIEKKQFKGVEVSQASRDVEGEEI